MIPHVVTFHPLLTHTVCRSAGTISVPKACLFVLHDHTSPTDPHPHPPCAHQDIFLANYGSADHVYLNQGGGLLAADDSSEAAVGALYSLGAVFGDLNGDQLVDLVVLADGSNQLYLNEQGALRQTSSVIGLEQGVSVAAALVDLEGDGDLDILVRPYLLLTTDY